MSQGPVSVAYRNLVIFWQAYREHLNRFKSNHTSMHELIVKQATELSTKECGWALVISGRECGALQPI